MINCSFVKSYEGFSIKIDLNTNGIHGIIGASGSGKSTALACIAGLAMPDSGFVEINNVKAFDKSAKISLPPQKRKASLVMQSTALFSNMTALENIRQCVPCGQGRHKAIELLSLFGVISCADKMPHQLSGGQAQRVAIARAIASQPSCLLLDEPFSALDAILKDDITRQVFDIIKSMDIPVLYVSHDLSEVLQVCHTLSVIENNQLSKSQTKADFLAKPNTIMGGALLKRLREKNI